MISVGDKIRASFVNFIKIGDPQVEGWECFDINNPKAMFWDEESVVTELTSDYVLSDFPDEVYKL